MFTTMLTVLGAILNRSRGAWFRMYIYDSGVAARFFWAVPTGIILWLATTPNLAFAENPFRVILLVLSCWAMWWPGSGAHSVMNLALWKDQWGKGHIPDDTESYSKWLLMKMFGETPNSLWDEEDFLNFHICGKAIEGVLRMGIMVLPICILAPWASLLIILSGLLWGMLFNLGWAVSDEDGWAYGELFTGAWVYLVLAVVFFQ